MDADQEGDLYNADPLTSRDDHNVECKSDITIYHRILFLKEKEKQMKISIKQGELKNSQQFANLSTDALKSIIKEKRDELLCEISDCQLHRTISDRYLLSELLHKIVMKTNFIGEPQDLSSIHESYLECIRATSEEQISLSNQVVLASEKLEKLQKEYIRKKTELLGVTARKRHILETIEEKQKFLDKQEEKHAQHKVYQRLKENLKETEKNINIISHPLRMFIAFGGLHWAKHKELTDVLLSLCKPLDEQLEDL